jgi:hypothetical protein
MDIVKGTVEPSAMVPVVALRVERTGIPNNLIAAVSDVLGKRYDRTRLVALFSEHGAAGHPPFGNRVEMCRSWLHDVNRDESMWPLTFLGKIIQSVMDGGDKSWSDDRKYIEDALAQVNLSYYRGELITRSGVEAAAQSHKGMPRFRDIAAVQAEFKRALASVDADPLAGIAAACSLLESLCKTYISHEGLLMPPDQSLKSLWNVASGNFSPRSSLDDDIKKILSGAVSIIDGTDSLRSRTGFAYSKDRDASRVEPRHARLAINAAYLLATFVIET